MFHYRQWLFLAVSALWLLSGASLSYAQKDGDDKTRAQAIESVKKNLARDPKNQGLQHALQCLERTDQCNDRRRLDQAMGSVKDNLTHHPEDQGMHHAMGHLERHHKELEHRPMGRDQPAPRDRSPGGDTPRSPGPSDRPHR